MLGVALHWLCCDSMGIQKRCRIQLPMDPPLSSLKHKFLVLMVTKTSLKVSGQYLLKYQEDLSLGKILFWCFNLSLAFGLVSCKSLI